MPGRPGSRPIRRVQPPLEPCQVGPGPCAIVGEHSEGERTHAKPISGAIIGGIPAAARGGAGNRLAGPPGRHLPFSHAQTEVSLLGPPQQPNSGLPRGTVLLHCYTGERIALTPPGPRVSRPKKCARQITRVLVELERPPFPYYAHTGTMDMEDIAGIGRAAGVRAPPPCPVPAASPPRP